MNSKWLRQLVNIENKGYAAFSMGIPLKDNPYQTGYRNQNGTGGSLQRQRRDAWNRGWLLAEKTAKGEGTWLL